MTNWFKNFVKENKTNIILVIFFAFEIIRGIYSYQLNLEIRITSIEVRISEIQNDLAEIKSCCNNKVALNSSSRIKEIK